MRRSPRLRPGASLRSWRSTTLQSTASWLNMAEIELSVLARQCLDRRIPDRESLAGEVGAWEAERNAAESSIDWRFTTEEARIKLKHLYPEIVQEPSYGPNLS